MCLAGELITGCLPILVQTLQDQHDLVKETSAWTIGRICEFHVETLQPEAVLPLVTGLCGALDDSSKVASQACFALYHLAQAAEVHEVCESNQLSPYMGGLVEKLFFVTTREDADENLLRSSAYEAINMLGALVRDFNVSHNVQTKRFASLCSGKFCQRHEKSSGTNLD
jgi:importin subunit beta-1